MELLGLKVKHKVHGIGTIIKKDGKYITVEFNSKTSEWVYPDSFEKTLVAEDMDIQTEILKIINDAKAETEKKRQAALEEATALAEEQRIKYATSSKVERQNVAFKCTYCDGGKSKKRIGFFGPCSVENIKNNVLVDKYEWCSKRSKCKKFLEGKLSYSDIETEFKNCELCYESVMLQKWKAEAGIVGTGKNKGKPMRMEKVQKNSLAVLTTRLPNSSEENRFVFAVFLVDEAYDGDNRAAGYVTTNSKWKIELTPEEASKILFWNYYRCPNAPDVLRFGSGLHRYLSDEQAAQILRDIAEVKTDIKEKEFAKEFFTEFCKKVKINFDTLPSKAGALCGK